MHFVLNFSPMIRPQTPLPTIRIVVTTDGERYTVVDISGAPDGPWIRRRILSKVADHLHEILPSRTDHHPSIKLAIAEQLYPQYSIYPSEVGAFALGGALSDRRLFALCRESGNPSGSLKFFVSPSPDQLS